MADTVSPTVPLPAASGESAGAVASSSTAPVAPAPAPAPAAVAPEAPAVSTPAAAETIAPATVETPAAASHEFKPSLLNIEPPAEVVVEPAKPGEPVTPPVDKPADKVVEPAKPVDKSPEKVAEPAAPEPIAYAFKWPETVDAAAIDKGALDKYTSILNKARTPPEVAQELADLHIEETRKLDKVISDRQWDVFNRQQDKWRSDGMADPEIGGARFKTAQRAAARFIEGMGLSPTQQKGIMDTMMTTGAGNHPDVFRLFVRAGERFFKEGEARNIPPARQVPLTREQRQAARYK